MSNLQPQMALLAEAYDLYGRERQRKLLMEVHIRARMYDKPNIFGLQLKTIIALFINDEKSGKAVDDDTEN